MRNERKLSRWFTDHYSLNWGIKWSE